MFFCPTVLTVLRQIFLWDINATGTLNNFTCSNNIAVEEGGCLFGVGTAIINNGTIMRDNEADQGGGICECRHHQYAAVFDHSCIWMLLDVF